MGQLDVSVFYSMIYVFPRTIYQVLQLRRVLWDLGLCSKNEGLVCQHYPLLYSSELSLIKQVKLDV